MMAEARKHLGVAEGLWKMIGGLEVLGGIGVLVGEWLHHRVDERRFRLTMYSLLLLASIALMARA